MNLPHMPKPPQPNLHIVAGRHAFRDLQRWEGSIGGHAMPSRPSGTLDSISARKLPESGMCQCPAGIASHQAHAVMVVAETAWCDRPHGINPLTGEDSAISPRA
ncbi:unnamed protein product [Symbiodinium sp. CCMP2456]|nr:unnamed protein product [Symbiodinium sp. CCMP2456]